MWMPRRPRESQLIDFLLRVDREPLNYASQGELDDLGGPTHFLETARLGDGERCYAEAVNALMHWRMLPESYVEIFWPARGMQCGTSLAIGMRLYGNYWLNPCRITEFAQAPACRQGDAITRLTWRTVRGHCLVGSESFTVRLKPSGDVWYEIESLAAPVQWLRPFRKLVDRARRNFQVLSCQQLQIAINRNNHHSQSTPTHRQTSDVQLV